MYNNRNLLIYSLLIAISVGTGSSTRVKLDPSHRVCSALVNPPASQPKTDLPVKKEEEASKDWIVLENCSIADELKPFLKSCGIDSELLANAKDEAELDNQLKFVENTVNFYYRQAAYFNSRVESVEYKESGHLVVRCREEPIPESSVRLFVRDETSPESVAFNLTREERAERPDAPTGKFRQLRSEHFVQKILGTDRLRFSHKRLEAMRDTGLYQNLVPYFHTVDGQVYLDFFFDRFGSRHRLGPTITVQSGGPLLNLYYKNNDFGGRKAMVELETRMNLFRALKYNHRFFLRLFSDVVELQLWNKRCPDSRLVSFETALSMEDVLKLGRKLGQLLQLDRLKARLREKRRGPLKVFTQATMGDLKEATMTSINKLNPKGSVDRYDSEFTLKYMRYFGDLRCMLSSVVRDRDVSLSTNVEHTLNKPPLGTRVVMNAELMNRLHCSHGDPKRLEESLKYNYRARTKALVELHSGLDFRVGLTFGNEMGHGDYREFDGKLVDGRFFVASHDLTAPLRFKNYVLTRLGLFLDLLAASKRLDDLNVSLGLSVSLAGFRVFVPLVKRANGSLVLNRFKGEKNFYFNQ